MIWGNDGQVNQRQPIKFDTEDRSNSPNKSPMKTGNYGIGWYPEFLYPSKIIHEKLIEDNKKLSEKWIRQKQEEHMFMIKAVKARAAKLNINNPIGVS